MSAKTDPAEFADAEIIKDKLENTERQAGPDHRSS